MAARERQMGNVPERNRRMAIISKVAILALFCTLLLEGSFALYRVGRGYGVESARFPLEPCEHHDYVFPEVTGGEYWRPIGPDPWIRFSVDREVGHIRLLFAEPLPQDAQVHLYYAQDGGFDRFRRKDGYLMKGSREAALTVPPGCWDSLRLDILGEFTLDHMEAAEAIPIRGLLMGGASAGQGQLSRADILEEVMGQVRWGRAAVLFFFLAAAGGLVAGRTGGLMAGQTGGLVAGRTEGIMTSRAGGLMAGRSGELMARQCRDRASGSVVAVAVSGSEKGSAGAGAEGPGAQPVNRERILYLDGIRVLAALLVIAAHVLAPMEGQFFYRPSRIFYLFFLGCMFFALTCNLLFFMLSGALLLPYRKESVGAFIRKRFLKVALPLLVYSIFYVRGMCFSVLSWKDWAVGYGRSLFSGQMTMAPHLWLVYALIGMYVLVLPLRALLRNISERTEKQLAFLTILFLGIRTGGQYLGMEPGISIPLDDWLGIFLMGYLLTRDWMRPYHRLWLKGGAAAFLISLGTGMLRQDYGGIVYGRSLLMLAMASALFIAMGKLEARLRPFGKLLSVASRYSYSVLLIHWYVLYGLVYSGLLPAQMPLILQILLPFLVCTALSLVLSAVVDGTVVKVVERVVLWAVDAGKGWEKVKGGKD